MTVITTQNEAGEIGWYEETQIGGTGAVAVTLFGGLIPVNGYEIINLHATENLYFREGSTAGVADGKSAPIGPLDAYVTPAGYKPVSIVSVNATTAAHPWIGRAF